MKIVVVSDTHGAFFKLKAIVDKHLRDADMFIHLGDGSKEFEEIQLCYPEQSYLGIQGNCDYTLDVPYAQVTELAGKRIFSTHGHLYGVKGGLDRLKETARQHHAHIVLYGHTHQNFTGYEDGLTILNPGSLARPRSGLPSYGIIDLSSSGILTNIVEVKRFDHK